MHSKTNVILSLKLLLNLQVTELLKISPKKQEKQTISISKVNQKIDIAKTKLWEGLEN